jgi:rod shape-determining protein MreD
MIAAFVQGPLIRLIPVGLVLLALQTTLFVELQPAGVIVQVMLALAAAAGAAGGADRGAIAGFVLGLMYDLGTDSPLGSTALTMALAGIVAGLAWSITVDPPWWLAAIFVALGAAVGEAAVAVVRTFTGEVDTFDERLYTIVPVVAVAAALLSPLFVPLSKWCLRIRKPEWKAPGP